MNSKSAGASFGTEAPALASSQIDKRAAELKETDLSTVPEKPRRHVLIVDDDQIQRRLLRRYLRRDEGCAYQFSQAATVAEALECLRTQPPDCILVDYLLPGQSGLKLLEHVQVGPAETAIAVILITAHGDQSLAIEAMKGGALDFLTKEDLTPGTLCRAVDNAMEKVEMRRELVLQREQLEKQNRELKRAEREAQEGVRRHDQFLAMLSHELRNPLAAVLHAANLLNRCNSQGSDAQQASQVILRQSEQMSRLLDDLLDVSRISQGKIQIAKEVLDVTATVEDAVAEVRPRIQAREQQLFTEISDEPIWVVGNAARLTQVQANLLANASKYTPPGESIWLSMRQAHGYAEIRVRDNGEGIPPEMLDSVFNLFVQSDDTLDRSEGGMGVGLTLVRALIKLHGGEVSAYSEGPGRGSEFVVRLPTAAAPSAPADEQPSGKEATAPLRIVLVEDNADSRQMLTSLLELDGHEVVTASDGRAGVDLVRSARPRVALVDIGLPELDGYEVAKQIRRDQSLDTYLVALTGYGTASDRQAALDAGFQQHLTKPVQLDELQNLLRAVSAKALD